MLKFGNREFRNLQEQVLKNMCDIQDIEQGATVLAAFGIKVVGQVNQASDLPAPTTYKGNLGDAFLVGTEAPYDYYIYAKAYDGQEQPAFYNLGQFPKPGPKGDAAGFGAITASATSVVGQPTVSVNTSGTNEAKNIAFEFGIPNVDLSNYATKPYVNEGLNKKVSRSSTTSGEYIYGIANGFDNIYPVQKQVGPDGIVQRTGNGNVVVPFYPASDDCAASKQYVDANKGTKLYKHVISGILDDKPNARLIIVSTSNEKITDRYPLMYNTELILKFNYCANYFSSERDVANVIGTSFNTGAYKLILIYFDGPTTTPAQLQINASGYTDTVSEL